MSDVDREDAVVSRAGAWHQSKLETLLDGCSWQYFLQYELNVVADQKGSASAGVAYHAALEAHEMARKDGRPALSFDDLLDVGVGTVRSLSDDVSLESQVRAALTAWWSAPMKDGGLPHREWVMQYEPYVIEPYFRVPLVDGADPIGGWIDAVYRTDGGEFLLVDHKTAESFSRWGHDGAEHRHQATMYAVALALSDQFPEITDLVSMTYMVSRKKAGKSKSFEAARRVVVTPTLEDVRVLGDRIRAAEQKVKDVAFVRRPDWVLCDERWCQYYHRCMVTNELAGTPESVRVRLASKGGVDA